MSLATRYLGLDLASPLVASCSPLTGRLDSLRALEDAGAAAVVLPSVFEEQLRHEAAFLEHFLSVGADSSPEADGFYPDASLFTHKSDRALDLLRAARAALGIPIIASLNGVSRTGWVSFARDLEQAGAQAIELNLYQVAADPTLSGPELELEQLDTVRAVRAAVHIPLAVKIGPYYSSLSHMARRFRDAGADALVLFNRFYQPDFDIDTRGTLRRLGLSDPRESLLPLSWTAILRDIFDGSLAASTGVHSPSDIVKYLMAGADAVMTTSALLQHGPSYLRTLESGLREWMHAHHYASVDELRGCLRRSHSDNPALFERANYIRLIEGFNPHSQHPA